MNIMNYATREVLTIAPEASLDTAISVMEERGVHHLVVMDERTVVGMLSDRDVLLSCGWMLGVERQRAGGIAELIGPQRVGQVMSCPVLSLPVSGSAREAALTMTQRKISALPIMQGDKLVGIITDSDLMSWLTDLGVGDNAAARMLQRPVTALMHARVYTVGGNEPLSHVLDLFRRHRIRHAPVIGKTGLVGIISDRDVRRAIGWANVREAQGGIREVPRLASEIMRTDVRTISPYVSLREALQKLTKCKIHSLPVIAEGSLLGILTQTDFVKAIAREELL